LIQIPLLVILSKQQGRDFSIKLVRDKENDVTGRMCYSKDFIILVETLSGETLNKNSAA
jgi:hypothetical protein